MAKALAKQDVEVYIIRIPRFGDKYAEVFNKIAERIPKEVDIIHCMHEYGLYNGLEDGFYNFLREHGKPVVTTMHATGNWQVDRIIAEKSDAVIVHNKNMAKLFRGKSHIIHHGVNVADCVPMDDAKKAYGIDPKALIVGYLGFISPYKGLETLINVMENVPEAGLLIAGGWHTGGDTDYGVRLKDDSLRRLQSRCQWIGYVPEDRLPYAYGSLNILCQCSNYVSESGSLLTGVGFGKAIIARNLAPNVEKEKEHALMTFKGEKDLEEKLHMLLGDVNARKKLEEGARKYAYQNRWSPNIAEEYIALYNSAIKRYGQKKKR